MNEQSIRNIEIMQKQIDKMNEAARGSPYSFTWSPPTNHNSNHELDYFCINCNCSLVQETKDMIKTNHPISLLYYFGQASKLEERISEINVRELNDWFHIRLTEVLSRYILSLSRISNDEPNVNFRKIQIEKKGVDDAV